MKRPHPTRGYPIDHHVAGPAPPRLEHQGKAGRHAPYPFAHLAPRDTPHPREATTPPTPNTCDTTANTHVQTPSPRPGHTSLQLPGDRLKGAMRRFAIGQGRPLTRSPARRKPAPVGSKEMDRTNTPASQDQTPGNPSVPHSCPGASHQVRLTCPCQRPPGPRHSSGIRPVIQRPSRRRILVVRSLVSRCLSTRRHSLLGHPLPPGSSAPITLGLPPPGAHTRAPVVDP
jgi:hypothetical protein